MHSVEERISHVPIYKKNDHYGFLSREKYPTIENMIGVLRKSGFTLIDKRSVKLTDQILPET